MKTKFKNVFLGIGSNLGNRIRNIELTKFHLHNNKIKILLTSSFFESLSWPDPLQPKFLNIIIKVQTILSPQDLYSICSNIETDLGRKKSTKNSPRTCDIDIIDYDHIVLKETIILPHPLMNNRSFVLLPLYEIDKTWKHPETGTNINKLIQSLSIKDLRAIKQI
jgi:2-amino-4-hydroxy-6-hydroxymethyldihydropteridine diphosphokinase|tara:strand:- start:566 stop:1060 length:495 start_codon:yes stop_codon:yes gene_type:complete